MVRHDHHPFIPSLTEAVASTVAATNAEAGEMRQGEWSSTTSVPTTTLVASNASIGEVLPQIISF